MVPRQQLHLVGGADERGIAPVLLDGLAVRRTELHIARRQQVLQHNLLQVRGLVKLVDVDKTYLRIISFLVLPLLNNHKLPANILIFMVFASFSLDFYLYFTSTKPLLNLYYISTN